MQAYVTRERSPSSDPPRPLEPPPRSFDQVTAPCDSNSALLDHLLGRLADLVADRLVERTAANASDQTGEWMDARGAAQYLGHRDTLRKLAAQCVIPTHQDGPRCKLYFRRDELDDWRRSDPPKRSRTASLRAV
jgi:hypothetical protein